MVECMFCAESSENHAHIFAQHYDKAICEICNLSVFKQISAYKDYIAELSMQNIENTIKPFESPVAKNKNDLSFWAYAMLPIIVAIGFSAGYMALALTDSIYMGFGTMIITIVSGGAILATKIY